MSVKEQIHFKQQSSITIFKGDDNAYFLIFGGLYMCVHYTPLFCISINIKYYRTISVFVLIDNTTQLFIKIC